MSHPKMIIEGVENCGVPLIKSDLLVEYIENYNLGTSVLTDADVSKCKNQIENI